MLKTWIWAWVTQGKVCVWVRVRVWAPLLLCWGLCRSLSTILHYYMLQNVTLSYGGLVDLLHASPWYWAVQRKLSDHGLHFYTWLKQSIKSTSQLINHLQLEYFHNYSCYWEGMQIKTNKQTKNTSASEFQDNFSLWTTAFSTVLLSLWPLPFHGP